uniref:Cytochrome c oxidase assembly protein COX16 homolog, mitochondrial n=1 Tax=Gopherus agassizii TaxID=38772 RepID=A0A452IVH3_9SAUR
MREAAARSLRRGLERLRPLAKNKTLRYGVPMMMDPALEERIRKNKISLESEYEKLKNSDFDDWKNIRGPRPWEDSKSLQEQQQQVLHSKPS